VPPSPPAATGTGFLQMCRAVRKRLPEGRYRHSLGVARTAERLARCYGVSCARARVAGVLHDIARHWSPEDLLGYARRHRLRVDSSDEAAPVLLHARVAADLARREFGVDDRDVLSAIATHTVAEPGMSPLQKILFVADACEPSRRFAGRAALERAALRSLDDGMIACIASALDYFRERGIAAAPQTMEVYTQLVKSNGSPS